MRRLLAAREHLDGDLSDAGTLASNLRDLRRINAWFGGTDLSIRAIRELVGSRGQRAGRATLRVLDVGTGAADIPLALIRARGPWSAVAVTAVDSRPEVLDAARQVSPGLVGDSRVQLHVADGRRLPWPDGSFDVAHASLVLHHLERADAVLFLRELARVATVGVVVNDVARSRVALLGARLVLRAMTRNRWTLDDAPLSVRRAWTRKESTVLLGEAGLEPVFQSAGLAGHRWVIAAVPG